MLQNLMVQHSGRWGLERTDGLLRLFVAGIVAFDAIDLTKSGRSCTHNFQRWPHPAVGETLRRRRASGGTLRVCSKQRAARPLP